jgi:hypothetical protein
MMAAYSEWDIVVREIGSGIWFWTSLWLTFTFAAYIIKHTFENRKVDRTLFLAACALTLYFMGSTFRGLLNWMQFYYMGNGWQPTAWVTASPGYIISVALNIVGGAACIWLLSNWRWRAIFTVAAVTGAVVAPIALHLLY